MRTQINNSVSINWKGMTVEAEIQPAEPDVGVMLPYPEDISVITPDNDELYDCLNEAAIDEICALLLEGWRRHTDDGTWDD